MEAHIALVDTEDFTTPLRISWDISWLGVEGNLRFERGILMSKRLIFSSSRCKNLKTEQVGGPFRCQVMSEMHRLLATSLPKTRWWPLLGGEQKWCLPPSHLSIQKANQMFNAHHTCWSRRLLLRESKNMLYASLCCCFSLKTLKPQKRNVFFHTSLKDLNGLHHKFQAVVLSHGKFAKDLHVTDLRVSSTPTRLLTMIKHVNDCHLVFVTLIDTQETGPMAVKLLWNDVVEWWNHLDSHHIWQCGYVLILLLSSQLVGVWKSEGTKAQ